jgi:hypothetical protein
MTKNENPAALPDVPTACLLERLNRYAREKAVGNEAQRLSAWYDLCDTLENHGQAAYDAGHHAGYEQACNLMRIALSKLDGSA